jgi:hypothetical protein
MEQLVEVRHPPSSFKKSLTAYAAFDLYFSSDNSSTTDSTGRRFNFSSQGDTTKALKFYVIGSDGGRSSRASFYLVANLIRSPVTSG